MTKPDFSALERALDDFAREARRFCDEVLAVLKAGLSPRPEENASTRPMPPSLPPAGPTCPVCGKGAIRYKKTGRVICLDDDCRNSDPATPPEQAERSGTHEPGTTVLVSAAAKGPPGAPVDPRQLPLRTMPWNELPAGARSGPAGERVLVVLRANPSRRWTAKELVEATQTTRSAIAQALTRLKAAGFVRTPAEKAPGRGGILYYELAAAGPLPKERPASRAPLDRIAAEPCAPVAADEVSLCVDAVHELPGRWLSADGVFERLHNPEVWRGGAQARAALVACIEVVLAHAATEGQLDRRVDEDGRATYHAPGTTAPNEKGPLMQGRRSPKGKRRNG